MATEWIWAQADRAPDSSVARAALSALPQLGHLQAQLHPVPMWALQAGISWLSRPVLSAGTGGGWKLELVRKWYSEVVSTRKADPRMAVVFDGDDTLWSTEPLYDAARDRARDEVEHAGLDGHEWERLERRIDVDNVSRFGFSTERFPTSCVEAYDALCAAKSVTPTTDVRQRIADAARTVFSTDPLLLPHAREILEQLREQGIRLALLTKGDAVLQRRRIDHSGLARMFDIIRVVDEKSPETFQEVVNSLSAQPERSWSIGNSIKSDVLPAIEAHLRAVWIDAHVWEHETLSNLPKNQSVLVANSIAQVPELITAIDADLPSEV